MSTDDRIRSALDATLPDRVDAAGTRRALEGRMNAARRRYRVRRAATVMTVSVLALGGTAFAVSQLAAGPDTDIGPIDSPPAPTDLPADLPADDEPAPSTTAAPTTTVTTTTVAPTTTVPTTTAPAEATTSTVAAEPARQSFPTECGTAVVDVGATTLVLVDSSVVSGYRFSQEGSGTDDLDMTWDDGPGDECELRLRLEGGQLRVDE